MKKRLLFALLLMGFTSLVVQVLLIREFLICFYGNELTIGLILGNWIILEAIGSGLSSKFSPRNKKPLLCYSTLQCLIALYFPVAIYLIRIAKNFMPLTSGEGLGMIPIFILSFFILAPLSIFDGAQFPLGCRIWKDYTKKPVGSVGSVYIFEAIGFIIAGPIFTFFLLTKLHSFNIAIIIGLLNLFSALLLVQKESRFVLKKILILFIVLLSCLCILASFNFSDRLHHLSLEKQWKGYTLLDSKNSIYGNLAVTKEKEQYTFFSDGIPIITSPVPDIITNEEFIHFGMLSHPNPTDVLIIGGGTGGPISEILKHPVRQLDYAELDPLLIKMVKSYPSTLTEQELSDPRLSIKITDGARYIKTTKHRYDVIFINLPAPTTLRINRFYTKDFFILVKNISKDNEGILVFSLPGSLSYLGTQLTKLNLSILNTLKEVFRFVKVIPGDYNLYLASSHNFDTKPEKFIKRLKQRNISTRLLSDFHINYRLHSRWLDWFYVNLDKAPKVDKNSSLLPKGLFYGLSYWNTLFSPQLGVLFKIIEKIELKLLLILTIFFVLSILCVSLIFGKLKRVGVPYAILTTGILGMTFDLILIFIYQSFYGYVYHHIALLITAFMLGLTLGAWSMMKGIPKIKNKKARLVLFEAGLIIFSLATVPLLIYLGRSDLNLSFVFFLLSAISGFLVGSEFPLANSLYQIKNSTQTAGILYALDLVGSWVGALIISVALLPVIGLTGICIFLAVLKLSSLLFVAVFKTT